MAVAAFLSSSGTGAMPPGLDVESFLASAARDGVHGLLHARICALGAADRLPPALVAGIRTGAHRQAVLELAQRAELQRVIGAMCGKGLDILLMKGASLAYDVYPDPASRPHADVDLFIRGADRDAVDACLDELGYHGEPEVSGRFVGYQFHRQRIDAHGIRHLYDVHWKIANPQRFANAVDFDELARDAVALPLLSPDARGIGRMHALWVACVHRAAHHYDRDAVVWLYDIHLLIGALDDQAIARFAALAEDSGVRRICARGLRLAAERLGTAVPAGLLARLEAGPEHEPSMVFLDPRVRKIDLLLDDVRLLRGWRARFALVKEHLFPHPAYMRRTYSDGSPAPMWWLYARRIAAGALKWLHR